MGLVDYSSSDSDTPHRDEQLPAAKKRKTSAAAAAAAPPNNDLTLPPSTLPPLPPSFHNLYATTVRPFTADLPSLHQGRKRAIPHVDGHWPSHIYIEWHPAPAHHAALAGLIAALAHALAPLLTLTSFLTSDLGAPLPLHVSLSRPFVLRTDQKASFRTALTRRIASAASVASSPFALCPAAAAAADNDDGGLAWFRSAEGGRSFLVLRVRAVQQEQQQQQQQEAEVARPRRNNPQLAALLAACNEVVGALGQPRLYARDNDGGRGGGVQHVGAVRRDGDGGDDDGVDGAFHVSLAWSFAEPTDEIRARTAAVFAREEEQWREEVAGIRIPVDGVKVKIGNVVTDVPLAKTGESSSGRSMGLFGV